MAPSNSGVAVIFGVGSNIGTALAKGFTDAGYRVATVSRSSAPSADSSSNPLHIQADLSDPAAVPAVFEKVKSAGLEFPSVVIWNVAALTPPPDPENPLSLADSDLDRDLNIMIKSPYVAAREAVKVWQSRESKDGRKGTFIMTGNQLPKKIAPVAFYTSLGIGKSGANHWVGTADNVLKKKGIRYVLFLFLFHHPGFLDPSSHDVQDSTLDVEMPFPSGRGVAFDRQLGRRILGCSRRFDWHNALVSPSTC